MVLWHFVMEVEASKGSAKRKARRRAKFIELLGGKCVQCGSASNLHFDHLDPSQKSHRIADILESNDEFVGAEVAKCQLLCQPCHHSKTLEKDEYGKRSEHGTSWRYLKYKCRCPECKKAISDYRKQRLARISQI